MCEKSENNQNTWQGLNTISTATTNSSNAFSMSEDPKENLKYNPLANFEINVADHEANLAEYTKKRSNSPNIFEQPMHYTANEELSDDTSTSEGKKEESEIESLVHLIRKTLILHKTKGKTRKTKPSSSSQKKNKNKIKIKKKKIMNKAKKKKNEQEEDDKNTKNLRLNKASSKIKKENKARLQIKKEKFPPRLIDQSICYWISNNSSNSSKDDYDFTNNLKLYSGKIDDLTKVKNTESPEFYQKFLNFCYVFIKDKKFERWIYNMNISPITQREYMKFGRDFLKILKSEMEEAR